MNTITKVELPKLDSLEQLREFRPREHDKVQELDDRIQDLKAKKREQREAREAFEAAEKALLSAKRRKHLGEATEQEVQKRREKVEEAKAAVQDTAPTEEAISELEDERESVIKRIRRKYRDRCRRVCERLISEAAEPVRRLLEIREQLDELESLYSGVGRKSVSSIRLRGEAGDKAAESMPEFPLPKKSDQVSDPKRRTPPLLQLKQWAKKWGDPSSWKRWGE